MCINATVYRVRRALYVHIVWLYYYTPGLFIKNSLYISLQRSMVNGCNISALWFPINLLWKKKKSVCSKISWAQLLTICPCRSVGSPSITHKPSMRWLQCQSKLSIGADVLHCIRLCDKSKTDLRNDELRSKQLSNPTIYVINHSKMLKCCGRSSRFGTDTPLAFILQKVDLEVKKSGKQIRLRRVANYFNWGWK